MSNEFDPYYLWLGIPAKEQPPHHYRLLGVSTFEPNEEVISIAAQRQMAHVKNFALGQHGDASQRLLNELAWAKICLLNPEKRKHYDDALRQQLGIDSKESPAKGKKSRRKSTVPPYVSPVDSQSLPFAQAPDPQAVDDPVEPDFDGRGSTSFSRFRDPMRKLGQYRLVRRLGHGSMGTVFLGMHTKLKQVVAIKLLPLQWAHDKNAVGRFHREMEAVGKLNHPNIIRARDAGEADGLQYLVMDFLPGVSLKEVLEDCGPLPITDACEIVRQTAVGLEHAHDHHLVHRDVKPSNLLISKDGQVVVLDLGLARLRSDYALTASNDVLGTADYMAPEQFTDPRSVDHRADIYSLGCMLYHTLTGQTPFTGPTYQSAVSKLTAHAEHTMPKVQELRPEVSDELAAVLEKMVARWPDQRFSTAIEAAQALDPYISGADLRSLLSGFPIIEIMSDPFADTSLNTPPRSAPSKAPLKQYCLEMLSPEKVWTHRCDIPPAGIDIGRSHGDVTFGDIHTMAARHAHFGYDDEGRLFVRDLGARNGVFLRITKPVPLSDSTRFRIGTYLMYLRKFEPLPAVQMPGKGEDELWNRELLPHGMLTLISRGARNVQAINLIKANTVIGRDPIDADIVLAEAMDSSRKHAAVRFEDGQHWLEDIGSRNGTYMQITRQQVLEPGDMLIFGLALFRVSEVS